MSTAQTATSASHGQQAASADRMVRLIFRLLAVTFGVVGAIFLLFPNGTVRAINATGSIFRVFPPAPESDLRFWLSLGVSYMALVTVLAVLIQKDPTRYRHLMPVLAVGKFSSSFTSLLFFVFTSPTFLYLSNFLVDGSITLLVLGCYAWTGVVSQSSANEARWVERSAPVLDALIETLFPSGGAFEAGGQATPLARDLSQYFQELHTHGLLGLGLLLRTLEYGPYVFGPRRTRFSRLSAEERERYLGDFERSRLTVRRQLITSLKLIGTLHFYNYPEVQEAVGYDGRYVREKLLAGPNAADHRARLQ